MGMMTANNNNNNNNNDSEINNNGSGVAAITTTPERSTAVAAETPQAPVHSAQSVTGEALAACMTTGDVLYKQSASDWYDADGDVAAIAAVAAECERLLAAATADKDIGDGKVNTAESVGTEKACINATYNNNDAQCMCETVKGGIYGDNDTDYADYDLDSADAEVLNSSAEVTRSKLDYTTSFASYDSHVHQLNRSHRCNSHATLKLLRQQRQQNQQQQQKLQQRYSAQQNSSSLKLSASNASICSSTTSTCPAYSIGEPLYQSVAFTDYGTTGGCTIETLTTGESADESVLRYSFKGYPPELYSPRKEFIYTRPLVEKQLVIKKTCEWWFYKNKCRNMSTHWKQNAFLICCVILFGLLLGLIIWYQPGSNGSSSRKGAHTIAGVSNKSNTWTSSTAYPPVVDSPDIQTIFINHSFIGDEQWTEDEDIKDDIGDINNSIPDDFTSDFVTPRKVYNSKLSEDDLLYESNRNKSSVTNGYYSAFDETGTFRSKSSQIWDPHPEYIINAFGHELHLVLYQDTSFIPPQTFSVIRILNNRTEEEEEEDEASGHYLGCYYKGVVQGDDQSTVSVSLCNGMTGYIKTSFGSLLIQPVNQTGDGDSEVLHKVWRHSRRNARHAVADSFDMDLKELEESLFTRLHRKKRNYVDRHVFTMEVLVAVDKTMSEFHGSDLKSYILTLISIVSNIYADASIGNSIYITVANILILRDDRRKATSASAMLKDFCGVVSKQGYHYDTAMLITRDQICRNEGEPCDTLGLAELGTVCKRRSCAIVQDNGLPAAFTIAHELGHVLNMPHDDDDLCKPFNRPGTKSKMHIMSSIMGSDIHPWSWSDCSRNYVSEFLEKEDKSCLEDTPTHFIKNFNTKLPGEIYSLNHQCQLIHGNQSRYCRIDGECKRLWCKTDSSSSDCRSSNLPWADGTPCNNERHWCQKGECVPREGKSLQVVQGGWGPWSEFTPCSLTCGGGVQESQRECNNPLPKNGGKYCAGSRKKYRSCNTHTCPPGTLDSREQQCYEMNGRNFSSKGIARSAKWIPKYGLSSAEKCKLFCRLEDNSAYFMLADKVKDGTTCSLDSFDKCVNGICRPAGCDNELNSLAKIDRCGVCEGHNETCQEYTGNFYVSDLYKTKSELYYYYVTTIPKGASNIVITQPGYHAENFIALRDDEGNYILNGKNVITSYHNIKFYAGVTIEYNGAENLVEHINTTVARKMKRDLVVEIISISKSAPKDNDSLLLSYTYTMDKPLHQLPEIEVEIYNWERQPWSNCDALCHGSSHRLPVCVSTTKALKVAPQLCDETAKPPTEYRQCNTDCVLSLNVANISECSASCGMLGTREKTYYCIQTFPHISRSNIVDLSYCLSKFEFSPHESCREGCWDYTEWTPCSKSCGTGTQTRGVGCMLNGTRVSDSFCDQRKRDSFRDTIRACKTEPCYSYEDNLATQRSYASYWFADEWGACDDNCEKNRTVTCRNPMGYGCPKERRPLSKRKCCNIKYVSNWSNCSVECGNGVRQKEIHCARVYKPEIKGTPRRRVIIDPYHCRHLRKPTPKRMHKPCKISCKWNTSDWTQCPADCHEEYQSRSVYCESVLGNPIAYRYCDALKKPPSKKICNNCVRKESKIITPCNCDGFRRRRIICYDSTGRRIVCPTKERLIKEKCPPPRECMPQSCEDVRRLLRNYQDDEYTIYVRSRARRVYCHNMSSSPKEYLTVNHLENYSIYYDYKTSEPNKCPPESRNREFRDNSTSSGRTNFRKIRINLPDLRVIENDFTFAETVGTPQLFGSAGDCYNRNKECPQGDFSINLEKTGFHIRAGARWDTFGHSVIMKVSIPFDTSTVSRRAFCGGYCGRCQLSHAGLYLDV
uniref:A disintegrin and metalloproteinase with thrombospondin motifs 9 n=2 Tax=Bactrocera latifrons TaxID=174628 RepID=A0A0K8VCK3_BACLA